MTRRWRLNAFAITGSSSPAPSKKKGTSSYRILATARFTMSKYRSTAGAPGGSGPKPSSAYSSGCVLRDSASVESSEVSAAHPNVDHPVAIVRFAPSMQHAVVIDHEDIALSPLHGDLAAPRSFCQLIQQLW